MYVARGLKLGPRDFKPGQKVPKVNGLFLSGREELIEKNENVPASFENVARSRPATEGRPEMASLPHAAVNVRV